jgi:hypothetical protein
MISSRAIYMRSAADSLATDARAVSIARACVARAASSSDVDNAVDAADAAVLDDDDVERAAIV